MSILKDIFKSLLNQSREINLKKLPSMGLFYKDDFKLWIKKADIEDIIEYEYDYQKEDVGSIIQKVKKIVRKNIILSKGYNYNDIKSVDIVYLFLEIVKLTNNKSIEINFTNKATGEKEFVTFDSYNFNYAKINDEIMKSYNSDTKEFVIDGFRYSPPCIGVETSLTNFLIGKSSDIDSEMYANFNYDFLYFLGHKNTLNKNEIENLIQIYNYDISEEDSKKIGEIIIGLSNIGKYSLKKDFQIIDITAKIDLEKIWK
jgi:hypothetical protein